MLSGSASNRFLQIEVLFDEMNMKIKKMEKKNKELTEMLQEQQDKFLLYQKESKKDYDQMKRRLDIELRKDSDFEDLISKRLSQIQNEISDEVTKKIERVAMLIKSSYFYERTKSKVGEEDEDGNNNYLSSNSDVINTTNSLKIRQQQQKNSPTTQNNNNNTTTRNKPKQFPPIDKLMDSNDIGVPLIYSDSSNINNIEKFITNEIKQLKNEMNSNFMKIDYLDTRIKDINSNYKKDFNSIQGELTFIKHDITNNKRNDINIGNNFNSMKDFVIQTNENLNSLSQKFANFINNNQTREENYDNVLRSHSNNFQILSDQFKKELQSAGDTYSIKFNNSHKTMLDKIEEINKELSAFEAHMLEEQDNFVKYVKSCFDTQNDNLHKISIHINQDIDMLKEKNLTFDNKIMKVKEEFQKNLNNSEEFFQNKYDTIFRMINK